jgi:hypothetical protein
VQVYHEKVQTTSVYLRDTTPVTPVRCPHCAAPPLPGVMRPPSVQSSPGLEQRSEAGRGSSMHAPSSCEHAPGLATPQTPTTPIPTHLPLGAAHSLSASPPLTDSACWLRMLQYTLLLFGGAIHVEHNTGGVTIDKWIQFGANGALAPPHRRRACLMLQTLRAVAPPPRAGFGKPPARKQGPRQTQNWFLKCLQGGRAHPLAACGVATLCCSPPALLVYQNPSASLCGLTLPRVWGVRTAKVAVLFRELRIKLDRLLADKIKRPDLDIWADSKPLVSTILQLLESERQEAIKAAHGLK